MLYYLTYGILDVILATSIWTINNTTNGICYIFNKNVIHKLQNSNYYNKKEFIYVDNDLNFISKKEFENDIKLNKILNLLQNKNLINI